MKTIRLALFQMNAVVGDLRGNADKIRRAIGLAKKKKADIVAVPELALTGYPPEDLVLKPRFVENNIEIVRKIASRVYGITAVVGFVDRKADGLYNAAAVIAGGRVADVYHKMILPNYGVFDEHRYFRAGRRTPVYRIGSAKVGITICEDIWHSDGPAGMQAAAGADVIVNINASPYEMGKLDVRRDLLRRRTAETGVPIAYLNTVGGQDELVFDGGSMVFSAHGEILASAEQFAEDFLVLDLELPKAVRKRGSGPKPSALAAGPCPLIKIESIPCAARRQIACPGPARTVSGPEEIYRALVLGTGDYVRKNGFSGVVIGLSGGIDSSLVAAVAADALGPEKVRGVFMPSRFSSSDSREDAFALAENLRISIDEVPIDGVFSAYLDLLANMFAGRKTDVTEENLQARIRGNILMALSNKFGWLVLTTGNKSEMSVGYATLYGDMAGGFAVIKDVPKTLVYEICGWRNSQAGQPVIPERVMTKEPTAELRPDQKDTDSLPAYPQLDPILRAYVEEARSFQEIADEVHRAEIVRRVIALVDRSEYKRRQAPPGVKITSRAFGRDWRFPITNRYRNG